MKNVFKDNFGVQRRNRIYVFNLLKYLKFRLLWIISNLSSDEKSEEDDNFVPPALKVV